MCHMTCARCVGGTLIPLAMSATLTNILLFFPGANKMDNNINLSEEVWYFGGILGSGVLMILPAVSLLNSKNIDCSAIYEQEDCGKKLKMLNTMMFLGTGIVGALYAFAISVVAIIRGPKCLVGNNTWEYPFHDGNYLKDIELWNNCKEPIHIVPWNLSFFSIQLIISGIQISLCGTYVAKICCGVSCKKCRCPKICRGPITVKPSYILAWIITIT
ncbi:transmembrane 4 L6 family member 4 isoform X1 [Antechinus flavipes]|uniref:transmembrane 4 L6 family member 4 isoform X1 n=1 Tax=Antechinus flavipes TaxID=38775 RepID=UPI002236AB26|nr:transmembrane 4 L6 family member 4 isoform X1 [Antechinus flavipes]